MHKIPMKNTKMPVSMDDGWMDEGPIRSVSQLGNGACILCILFFDPRWKTIFMRAQWKRYRCYESMIFHPNLSEA